MELKREGILFCLIGPTAGGKTTLASKLLGENPETLRLSVSTTSRLPREGESEGESYFFVSREDFEQKIKKGEFFEWEEIHGNLYGTAKSAVDGAISSGRDLLLDIDIRGAVNFKKSFPGNAVISFLIPPSIKALRDRIRGRGAIEESDLEERLATARREFEQLKELAEESGIIDYFVVNDKFEATHRILSSILAAERVKLGRTDMSEVKRLCSLR